MYNKIVSSGWIKTAFLLGVLGFMGYTTYHAVYSATSDTVIAWLSLFLFDAGAFASYRMYIGDAEGAPQRTAATTATLHRSAAASHSTTATTSTRSSCAKPSWTAHSSSFRCSA